MNKYRVIFFFIFLFLFRCNPPPEQPEAPVKIPEDIVIHPPLPYEEIFRIDSLLDKVLDNYRFNGNVLIAKDGFPIYEYSHGFADLYTKDTLNLNTVFQLASVSKGFTAMAVLILKQRGLISLDDSLKTYIPEFPFDNITIKQLLQHTSGMQNYMYFVDHYWDDEKSITNEDVLDLIISNNPQLNFTPGRRHHYNNTGYTMLALLVERVSGKSYYEFVQDEIFEPLGMDHTFAWNQEAIDTITNIATGFTRRGWRYRKFSHDPLDEVLGDKSIYSTVRDLLKWDQALYTSILINDSLLLQSFQKTVARRGRTYNYGFGWRLKEVDGKQVIYHNGLWNGFTSSLTRYVDDKITIIILNNTNAPVASIVRQIHSLLDRELDAYQKQSSESLNNLR